MNPPPQGIIREGKVGTSWIGKESPISELLTKPKSCFLRHRQKWESAFSSRFSFCATCNCKVLKTDWVFEFPWYPLLTSAHWCCSQKKEYHARREANIHRRTNPVEVPYVANFFGEKLHIHVIRTKTASLWSHSCLRCGWLQWQIVGFAIMARKNNACNTYTGELAKRFVPTCVLVSQARPTSVKREGCI